MRHDDVIYEAEDDEYVLRVLQDYNPQSPREFDNFGTMLFWISKYDLGDKHGHESAADFLEEINETNALILSLQIYEHSELTMSWSVFNEDEIDKHDGFLYVKLNDVLKEYGRVDAETIKKAYACLEAEAEVYEQYIKGDVCCFSLVKKVKCDACGHVEEEDVNSCHGFFGYDVHKNGIADTIGEKFNHLIDMLK